MSAAAYEHNHATVSREAFYAIACDPRRSVAVEACAGAGKTWMLVSRIVRALLDGCPAHEILAITFTKKAAGEMRARLHEWLAEFAQTPLEDLALQLRIRGISDEMMLQRTPDLRSALQSLQKNLLATGRPVQIRTFHSWFAALLRTAPLAVLQNMGLPTNYELLEDDTEAVAQVWLPFYAAVLADAGLQADYHAVVSAHGRAQTHKALAGALSRRVEFTLADEAGVVDASVQAWDVQFPTFAGHATPAAWLVSDAPRAQLLAAARALGQASAKTFSAKGGELEVAVSLTHAAGICDALLTQKGEPRKFGEKIVGIDQVRLAQDLVQQYNAAHTQHEAWDYQQRMARLSRVLVAQFASLKRARGWVDMNDVERAAQTMLSDSVLSGWMQERLDARVRHLLIDEFQDTNPLQWQALHAWLSGYAGTGGGAQRPSVFIVGDPKQSIYRFRRAEPQVFRAAQDFVVDGLGGDRLSCDHTRRNAPGIIDAVNQTMAAAQAAGEYSDFRTHTTESTSPAAVLRLPQISRAVLEDAAVDEGEALLPDHGTLAWRDSLATPREVPEETLRTLECRQAAQWLVATMAQHSLLPKDVMVLSRRRVNLGVMRDALRDLQVAAEQPEKNDLGDAPEVQDVLALLDVLVSPAHDLSLARALRSPLWSLSDDDLVQIALAQRRVRAANAGEADSSWWGLLQNDELLPQHIRALAPVLVLYKSWVDQLPPHDALDAIYQHGDVLARFAAAAPATQRQGVLDNLRALLGAALNHAGGRYATPYGFVRALKAGGTKAGASVAEDADGAGAVRLLTVHGAKGLEAKLVLLLDTDGAPAKSESMGVLVDWPGESAAPERFLFLVRETNPPACAVEALQTEQAARQREELNGLYVAMTRAARQLVLSSVEPHRANPGSWWQRVQALCTPVEAAEVVALSAQQAAEPEASFLLKILPNRPLAHDGIAVVAIKNEVSQSPVLAATPPSPESLVGQAMHRLLEWAPLGASAADHCAAGRAAVAREFALGDAQATLAATMAQRILEGAGAWAWQADRVDWVGNEVALVASGALVRLDRLVRRADTGEWWVLDYKSAAQPQRQQALREQLHTYRQAVQALEPGSVVRAAFLTGQGELEELEMISP